MMDSLIMWDRMPVWSCVESGKNFCTSVPCCLASSPWNLSGESRYAKPVERANVVVVVVKYKKKKNA